MDTHRHTQTHTDTHRHTQTHTDTHRHTQTQTHTHTQRQTHTNTQRQTHTDTNSQAKARIKADAPFQGERRNVAALTAETDEALATNFGRVPALLDVLMQGVACPHGDGGKAMEKGRIRRCS